MKNKNTIWLATTPDELELPIAVADTSAELASLLKTRQNALLKVKCRMAKGASPDYYKIFKIEYKEGVEDEQI